MKIYKFCMTAIFILLFLFTGFCSAEEVDMTDPEEVVKAYVEFWIHGDMKGMYDLMYSKKLTFDEFNKAIGQMGSKEMRPREFLGFVEGKPIYEIEYAVKVPEIWEEENDVARIKVFLVKDHRNEWKILGDRKLAEIPEQLSFLPGLSQIDQIRCEEKINTYINALISGDVEVQMSCFARSLNLTEEEYVKSFKFMLEKNNRPVIFVRIEKMTLIKKNEVKAVCVIQVPPTWQGSLDSLYLLEIYLVKEADDTWGIVRVEGKALPREEPVERGRRDRR